LRQKHNQGHSDDCKDTGEQGILSNQATKLTLCISSSLYS